MKEKIKIAVCGASQLYLCSKDIKKKAEMIGREIAKNNCVLLNGATSGVAQYSSLGAKKEKGFVIGFSPAGSRKDHIQRYKLPVQNYDIIFYTGLGYTIRNVLLTTVADGIIVVCGRFGTLHELTTFIEKERPIGILEGSGGVADLTRNLIKRFGEISFQKIVFDKDPKNLVKKLIQLIDKGRQKS